MQSLIDRLLALVQPKWAQQLHPLASFWITLSFILMIYAIWRVLMRCLTRRNVPMQGKHCYITGGSKGLGKSLAELVARQGAHVTIAARNEADLKAAVEEIKVLRKNTEQRINYVIVDVTDADQSTRALKKAQELCNNHVPDYVFMCAGQSMPGMFLDQDVREFQSGMNLNYFGTLYTCKAAAQLMVEHKVSGRLVIISSVVGLFCLVGYSQYAPTKFALRGLAETLSQELHGYGIKVHIMFPGTIFTPGFYVEQERKPTVTKVIEGTDDGMTPEAVAKALLHGMARNYLFISSDFIGEIARCLSKGFTPSHAFLSDAILCMLGWMFVPLWRVYRDWVIRRHHGQPSPTKETKKSK